MDSKKIGVGCQWHVVNCIRPVYEASRAKVSHERPTGTDWMTLYERQLRWRIGSECAICLLADHLICSCLQHSSCTFGCWYHDDLDPTVAINGAIRSPANPPSYTPHTSMGYCVLPNPLQRLLPLNAIDETTSSISSISASRYAKHDAAFSA